MRDIAGALKCNYRDPKTKKPCKNWALRGLVFCRHHKDCGQSPQVKQDAVERVNSVRQDNIAALESLQAHSSRVNPAILIEAYEDLLPGRLRDRYLAIIKGDVLNLTEEAAILELRVQECIQLLDAGGVPELWKQLWVMRNNIEKIEQRRANPSYASDTSQKQLDNELSKCLATIYRLIDAGHQQNVAWNEISRAIEDKRRLVETERKRIAAAGEFITQQDATNLFLKFQSAVEAHVNPETLAQIYATFESYADGSGTRSANAP